MGYVNLNCFDDLQNYDVPFAIVDLTDFDDTTRIIYAGGHSWELTSQDWSNGFKQYRFRCNSSMSLSEALESIGGLGIGTLSGYSNADISGLYDPAERFGSNDSTILHEPYTTLYSTSTQTGHINYTVNGTTYQWGNENTLNNKLLAPLCAKIGDNNYYGAFWVQEYGGGGSQTLISLTYSTNVTESNFGEFEPDAGDEGFEPTNDYNGGKTIGGRGKGSNGGHGKRPSYGTDTIAQPDLPDESQASIIGAGFVNVYVVDSADLVEFGKALFGQTMGGFFVNTAVNPLDYVISLNIMPYFPKHAISQTAIQLGRYSCTADLLDYSANGWKLTSQYNDVDFGTLQIGENWGSYLDYMSKVELYLPFIGTVNIDPSEILDGSINVKYIIDFFTGSCVANVLCTKSLVVPSGNGQRTYTQYSQHCFQGNCAVQVPVTSTSYGSMVGSLIKATTTFISSGGSPVGLAMSGASLVGDVFSGNMTSNGSSKGNITANGGYCSVLYPYVRITRPVVNIPESYQETVGFPSYVDKTLASCTGLCVCDSINLRGLSGATDNEIQRIEQMCKEGIYI